MLMKKTMIKSGVFFFLLTVACFQFRAISLYLNNKSNNNSNSSFKKVIIVFFLLGVAKTLNVVVWLC